LRKTIGIDVCQDDPGAIAQHPRRNCEPHTLGRASNQCHPIGEPRHRPARYCATPTVRKTGTRVPLSTPRRASTGSVVGRPEQLVAAPPRLPRRTFGARAAAPGRHLHWRELNQVPRAGGSKLGVCLSGSVRHVAGHPQPIQLSPACAPLGTRHRTLDNRRGRRHLNPSVATLFLVDKCAHARLAADVVAA